MIKGIGIDIIELCRIESSLNKGDRLAARVLTDSELTRYEQFTKPEAPDRIFSREICGKRGMCKSARDWNREIKLPAHGNNP